MTDIGRWEKSRGSYRWQETLKIAATLVLVAFAIGSPWLLVLPAIVVGVGWRRR